MNRLRLPFRPITIALVLFSLLIGTMVTYAYNLNGRSWTNKTATFYVSFSGFDASTWNSAFEGAMASWNSGTNNAFQYRIIRERRTLCAGDINTTEFDFVGCDNSSFGSGVLAVTYSQFFTGGALVKAPIVFNQNFTWQVYSGSQRQGIVDFRRVALHELGHALGLGHEEDVPAIMAARVNNIDSLQADDIDGACAIYGPCSGGGGTTPPPTRPTNDLFSAAVLLNAGSLTGSNVNATKETGEPNHAGNAGGASIWYRMTLAAGDQVRIDTIGSTFDTTLAAYRGSSVSSLTLITANDDTTGSQQSQITFTAASTATYYVAVDGYNGATGSVRITRTNLNSGATTPQTGLYYNASQGGRGYSLQVNSSDRLFFATYGYSEAGPSVWYVATLNRTAGTGTFTGNLLQVTGGQVLGGTSRTPTVTDRGSMTLAFTTTTSGRVTWPASFGPAIAVDITRYPVNGSVVTPTMSGIPAVNGWWAASSEPGRGYFFDIQGAYLFLATYMYRADGSAVWYVSGGGMSSLTSYSGTLQEYQGGPSFNVPTRSSVTSVPLSNNAVSVVFGSATSATVTIGGRGVTITPYAF